MELAARLDLPQYGARDAAANIGSPPQEWHAWNSVRMCGGLICIPRATPRARLRHGVTRQPQQ
eukprot:3533643-Alexandrium_andersonii.AAC.1